MMAKEPVKVTFIDSDEKMDRATADLMDLTRTTCPAEAMDMVDFLVEVLVTAGKNDVGPTRH